ncbi:AAA family ATPase [Bradyrhizobium japonicum]|uniref:AAA family ATPase n=1 Tax=Bradyrhizobium japonicum TaxID=375 RepID=UPI00041D9294|nr:ATP-binding protein [Bradyrhizobium japonicum]
MGTLNRIQIRSFKKINSSELDLSPITVLVGGNNSGKSCFLQGIHFGATLSQSQISAGAQQFPPEKLRYCPTDDFLNLRHGERLTETSEIVISFTENEPQLREASISLTRGRNGVVKAVGMDSDLGREISNPKAFFTIYVPGLAGVAIREEYRSDLVVNNGIARGDANLYLRNVLLRIQQHNDRRLRFTDLLNRVFPGVVVTAKFDLANDLFISADATLPDGRTRPLDMSGTGLLQAVQLLAYVTNYEPKLLLLDEPDAHLHPNNQRLLAQTLNLIARESETQILLATHSRHLLDALSEYVDAKLYWVKDGSATPQETWSDVAVLIDLGALDRGEQFLHGQFKYLVWTEDTNTRYLEALLEANGFPLDQTLVFSYKASSKIDAAALMVSFVQRVRPGVKLIVHRDRDFMTDDEVARLTRKYSLPEGANVALLITKFSDVEGYFAQASHLAASLQRPIEDMTILVDDVVRNDNNTFVIKFRDKREEIKRTLYKGDEDNCPDPAGLLPANQITVENAMGKLLLRKLNAQVQALGMNPASIIVASLALRDEGVSSLL